MQKMGRNASCWCGSGRKYKYCHSRFDERLAEYRRRGAWVPARSIIKNETQIAGIRESGKRNTEILDEIGRRIQAGVTTEQIDIWVQKLTIELGGIPAPLHYEGFPKSVCTSVNEVVCHGIPSKDVVLKSVDIVNVDVSTIYRGFYSDSSRMFCIGKVSEEKQRLVETARECIEVGLREVRPWGYLGDMGQAIHDFAVSRGYQVVREIGGHGIGLAFHEDPWVSYVSLRGTEMLMVPGMCFTIEPMINEGTAEILQDEKDGWTIRTADGKPSAQWEVQILVTEDGYEIFAY